eukprot:726040-Karenia_brevis.AAC.1
MRHEGGTRAREPAPSRNPRNRKEPRRERKQSVECKEEPGDKGKEDEEVQWVMNSLVKGQVAKLAAQKELVDRAKELSNESVVVEAPKEARDQVAAASSKSAGRKAPSSPKGWEPSLPSSRKVSISDPP